MGSNGDKELTPEECNDLHLDIISYIRSYKKEIAHLNPLKNPNLEFVAGAIFDCLIFKPSEEIGDMSLHDANLNWLSRLPAKELYGSLKFIVESNSGYIGLAKELIYELKLKPRQTEYDELRKRGSYAKKTGD